VHPPPLGFPIKINAKKRNCFANKQQHKKQQQSLNNKPEAQY